MRLVPNGSLQLALAPLASNMVPPPLRLTEPGERRVQGAGEQEEEERQQRSDEPHLISLPGWLDAQCNVQLRAKQVETSS